MRVLTFASLTTAAALAVAGLAGCGGGSDDDGTPTTPTTAATTNSNGTTVAGTQMKLGKDAVVPFKADKSHKSLIRLTVTNVKKGKVKDLKQFELTDKARTSTVYYVSTHVKNLGPDSLSHGTITLYGKVTDELVVPPVVFGSTFSKCDYQPLPKKFKKGKTTKGCMVMLAPKHGKISEIQWRAPDDSEPISWTLH
jgi:hypothetical protein